MPEHADYRIAEALERLVRIEGERRDIENQLLDFLRTHDVPSGFVITEQVVKVGDVSKTNRTITKGEEMPPTKSNVKDSSVNLQILDNGKGVLYTLQPVNAQGKPVPLPPGSGPISAVSSARATLNDAVLDPGDPTAVPPRPPDTTGLVFLATVVQPPVDATGVTMTFSDTLTSGNVISTTADGVDVTADDSPIGFSITETAA